MDMFSKECIDKNLIQKYLDFADYAYKRMNKENKYFNEKIVSCMLTFTLNERNRSLIKKMDKDGIDHFLEQWKEMICNISKSKLCIEFHIVMEYHKDGTPHFHCAMKSRKYPANFAHRILKNIKNKYGNYDLSTTKTNNGIEGALKYMSKSGDTTRIK